MKFFKTFLLLIVAIIILTTIYYFTVYKEKKDLEEKDKKSQIVYLKLDQINFIEIKNKMSRFVFQKNSGQWFIQEPVSDKADTQRIMDMLSQFVQDKHIALVKESTQEGPSIKWSEFSLDHPDTQIVFKNNLGQSQKIMISDVKNFEGYNYARIDNENKILVVNSMWYNILNEKLVYFREKMLYRGSTKSVRKISIKSLSDKFILLKTEKGWVASGHEGMALDQNKVNQIISSVAESSIQDYLFEGEPSEVEKKEKGLFKDACTVEFESEDGTWAVTVALNDRDKILYALTEKPTYLVKLDLSKWEFFGNLNLDSLRDRKTIMTFDISAVDSIFFKNGPVQFEFIKNKQSWILKSANHLKKEDYIFNPEFVTQMINKIHNFEMSHFLSDKEAESFQGQDMIILRTANDQLLYQFNWGPLIKKKVAGVESEYYLARTQASDSIFGFDKKFIDELPIDKIMTLKK